MHSRHPHVGIAYYGQPGGRRSDNELLPAYPTLDKKDMQAAIAYAAELARNAGIIREDVALAMKTKAPAVARIEPGDGRGLGFHYCRC
jgi:hypothetical protein